MSAISETIKVAGWARGIVARVDAWTIPSDSLSVAQGVTLRNGRIDPRIALGDSVVAAEGLGPYGWLWRFDQQLGGDGIVVEAEQWGALEDTVYSNVYSLIMPTDESFTQINGVILLIVADGDPSIPHIVIATTDPGAPLDYIPGLVKPVDFVDFFLSISGAGQITDPSVAWRYTEVDFLGNESPPSKAFGPQPMVAESATMEVGPPINVGVDEFRFYRTVNGTYVFLGASVGDVSAGYIFVDDTAVENVHGEALATIGKTPAPPLTGMAFGQYDNRWAGWNGALFYQSVPGDPGDWRGAPVSIGAPITAAIGTDFGWLVLTADTASLVTGSSPTMTVAQRFTRYGCPAGAAFSIVRTNIGWVWWSKLGLVAWDGQSFTPLMRDAYRDEQVAQIDPVGLRAAFVDDEYRLFHGCGCLHVDLRFGTPVFTTSCITADALFQDRTGLLYVADSDADTVKPWNGTTYLQAVVRFGEIAAQSDRDRMHVHGAQIAFTGGTLSAQWYQAGVAFGPALAVPAHGLLRISWGAWERTSLELWGDATIHSVTFNPFS